MHVQLASDGSLIELPRSLGEYRSYDELADDIAAHSGVSADNILLFLDDGRQVVDEVLREAWARGGSGSQSSQSQQVIFLFNRETFWGDPENWAAQVQEELYLPPALNLSAIENINEAQQPFVIAYDHISHLQALFIAQARALSIAYANLSQYILPLASEFEEFAEYANTRLENQERLLRGTDADLAMLSRIPVHEAFEREKKRPTVRDRSSLNEGEDGKPPKRTLADLLSVRKLQLVKKDVLGVHDDHSARYERITQDMVELSMQADVERRASEERVSQVEAEFADGLRKITGAMEHLERSFASGDTFGQDLRTFDQAIREDIALLTDIKNDFTLDVHIHLKQVAQFQLKIGEIRRPLLDLQKDMDSHQGLGYLERLHRFPLAYAASMVEIVRRKEFAAFLLEWAERLANVLGRFTDDETARRSALHDEVLVNLTTIPEGLIATSRPQLEVVIGSGQEALSIYDLGRADIENMRETIVALRSDSELQAAVQNGEMGPVEYLIERLDDLIANMDLRPEELDRMVEKSVLLTRTAAGTDAVLSASPADAELEQARAHHTKEIERLEEQHEQRITALQTRQAELQEELVRLRTDLSDEMQARQALSAEWARDQEDRQKEQDDQVETIRNLQAENQALQAELTDERKRATDLGVRLQEESLDVDVLKHAEQSLTAQVTALQEERSTLNQTLAEAQNAHVALQTEMAGLRAELEASNQQLAQARREREAALQVQSEEAVRQMRDQIAEADGDRAVLEELNMAAKKEMEAVKLEMEKKLTDAKNAAIRRENGLKAELAMQTTQLRESQRRETVLVDELAMAKDALSSVQQKETLHSDVAKDAVALASKYHDACQRILSTICASSTITGMASTHLPKLNNAQLTATPTPFTGDMHESVLVRSLAAAGSFDLEGFSETVNRTIVLLKKWCKSCKHYREATKNRIAFANFAKGDLALFLPTRNATTKPWMAFNVSAPYHFMRAPEEKQEEWKLRDNIIARITDTKESVAGDTVESNPFGLATGLTYYLHEVEEYDPHAARQPRRSASASAATHGPGPETNVSQMLISPNRPSRQMSAPNAGALALSPAVAAKSDGYFPPVGPAAPAATVESAPAPASSPSPTSPSPASDDRPIAAAAAPSAPPPTAIDPRLSPVSEVPPPLPRLSATVAPRRVPQGSGAIAMTHRRNSSRTSLSSSPLPHGAPVFTPSSGAGRPASVASNHSLSKGLPPHPTAGAAAPPMVTTLSGERLENPFQRQVILTPPSSVGTSTAMGERRPSHSSPLAGDARAAATAAGGGSSTGESGPFAALGTTSAAGTSRSTSTASKLVRGFAGRVRRMSGSEAVQPDATKADTAKQPDKADTPSAALDALRKF